MLKNSCQEINGYWYSPGLPEAYCVWTAVYTNFETSFLFVVVGSENGFCLLIWDKLGQVLQDLQAFENTCYKFIFNLFIWYKYFFFLDIFEGMDKMYTSYLYYKKWYNHKNKLII